MRAFCVTLLWLFLAFEAYARPMIIGHRGASGLLPEHTMEAYQLAVRQGADAIEPDLVSTKDGVLIIRHENELSGTTNIAKLYPKRKRTKQIDGRTVTGWFSEDFTWKELKRVRAIQRLSFREQKYNGRYAVLSFAEFLRWFQQLNRHRKKKVAMVPELKHSTYFRSIGLPLEQKMLTALRKYGLDYKGAPVYVQSFEVGNLQWLRKNSKLTLVQLLLKSHKRPYDFVKSKDKRTYGDLLTAKGLHFVATYAHAIGPWKGLILKGGRDAKKPIVTPLVRLAHQAGLKVIPYTFRNESKYLSPLFHNDPLREYHFFFQLGIDGLFSDFPGTAVKAWKQKTSSKNMRNRARKAR